MAFRETRAALARLPFRLKRKLGHWDQLGRSGLTGLVDTKFDERFGGAALISIIGAAPAVAANSTEDEVTREVLEEVGNDLEDATSSVIADQVSISPTIYVDQGAMVTVLVDRDVVVY